MSRMIAVNLCEAILELGKDLVVVEISHEVIEAACKTFPNFVFDAVATILSDVLQYPLSKIFLRHRLLGHTHHRDLLPEQSHPGQAVQRGDRYVRRDTP